MAERTFESQMARLEEIVRLLERGEAPLNESMKLFRGGHQAVRVPRQAAGQGRAEGHRYAGEHAG